MGKELFSNIPSSVDDLLTSVKNGMLGLPDLQRPFVWKDNKVRDLLDSMLKGYPIGYIMTWQSPEDYEKTVHVGANKKSYSRPVDLVIDGQQRLTALLAAMHGIKVKDKNYSERLIRIAFNPLTREFAVWSQAYERNTEWVSAISTIFTADKDHNISKFRKQFIKDCNAGREKNGRNLLSDEEEELIETNINDLLNLSNYVLPQLRINTKATEEDVAEVFVRVNSGGQTLTENNFIETLLAVYDKDVHQKIDQFCESSRIPQDGTSYNFILKVDPSHLIRMAVAVGFRRARLRYAYMLMRGKNLDTGIVTKDEMDRNLELFKNALDKATDLNNWHAFMNLFSDAGYVNGNIVASTNAVVFCYVLYLVGKYDYKVPPIALQKIIKKWIFMSTITFFYTGSTESEVEKQFADLRNVNTADEFISYLNGVISTRFTEDYFDLKLPSDLAGSAATSPAWYGYIASLNVLGTPMLFSTTTLASKMLPGASGGKKAIDKHHIFPKNYLTGLGYKSDRDRNQIANFTYLDYNTNIDISDKPPAEYVNTYRQKLGEEGYRRTCAENALPVDFENMSYPAFLEKRRKLMAEIVKRAYQKLCE
ncbi:MAG: DUF262 domain-containing protein [Thermoguttaceae bacterium]|nr:DUF262 domain-containing protein [Thermoguttaceae bacterium]